jgi:uncharacterized hydrophobic protein (TIGR00341 family)
MLGQEVWMALRLIEMVCPEAKGREVEELVGEHQPLGVWQDRMLDERVIVKILLPAEKTEAVLDRLESRYGGVEGVHMFVLAVEAALPRPEPSPQGADETSGAESPVVGPSRISRQELYAHVSSSARLTRIYLAMIVLSSVVAAVGLARDNVAVIIGAMVIAPLLGPNMALAFAATLGDARLGWQALRTAMVGTLTALVLSVLLGMVLHIGATSHEILVRAEPHLADVVLALAAGSAGALAFTTGIHTPLVGVMVAVALLPPLVALGLLLGSGQWGMALGTMLLFLTNLICVNLAGVATFLARGVRPRTWWEADKARKAARITLVLWILLLLALVAAILLLQR